MKRSVWKGVHCNPKLANELKGSKKVVKVFSRSSTILPDFLGKTVAVHNGISFKEFVIESKHIGQKFGQFHVTKYPALPKKGKRRGLGKR